MTHSAPISRAARMAAHLSFAAGTWFLVLLVLLHFLKPEIDPSWRFISEYELGAYGWLMRAAFFLLATCTAALAVALRTQVGLAGHLGLAFLVLSAVGMCLAAIFVTDPATLPPEEATRHGKLHQLGATLDTIPFAALLLSWSLARNERWAPLRRTLLWTAWLPLLGVAGFVIAVGTMLSAHEGKFGPDVLVGWPNRLMVLLQCGWLMFIARRASTLPQ